MRALPPTGVTFLSPQVTTPSQPYNRVRNTYGGCGTGIGGCGCASCGTTSGLMGITRPITLAGLRQASNGDNFWTNVGIAAAVLGGSLGAYHGYRRSDGSLASTFGWTVGGLFLPFIVVPVALAQGLGDRR